MESKQKCRLGKSQPRSPLHIFCPLQYTKPSMVHETVFLFPPYVVSYLGQRSLQLLSLLPQFLQYFFPFSYSPTHLQQLPLHHQEALLLRKGGKEEIKIFPGSNKLFSLKLWILYRANKWNISIQYRRPGAVVYKLILVHFQSPVPLLLVQLISPMHKLDAAGRLDLPMLSPPT